MILSLKQISIETSFKFFGSFSDAKNTVPIFILLLLHSSADYITWLSLIIAKLVIGTIKQKMTGDQNLKFLAQVLAGTTAQKTKSAK
jgi:hypothetical protein